jgi:hypothetical protein
MSCEVSIHGHFYQPPRTLTHESLEKIPTSLDGIDWNKKAEDYCYKPIAQLGTLDFISFDALPVLLKYLETTDPQTADIFLQAFQHNGVESPFVHALLPDLDIDAKRIIIGAGRKFFYDRTGCNPRLFWLPETAVDRETIEILKEYGYEGFLCAPKQLDAQEGKINANQLYRIKVPQGYIIAWPFDSEVGGAIAFGEKHNADTFVRTVIKPGVQKTDKYPLLISTDGETFGLHWPFGCEFLDYLARHALGNQDLRLRNVNDWIIDIPSLPEAKIKERTAWSDPNHGDLIRWHGWCECREGQDASWKAPFYQTFQRLYTHTARISGRELGGKYVDTVISQFEQAYDNPGGVRSCPQLSLISSLVSALVARTSCGTFFPKMETSGYINIAFGYQAIVHLRETGIAEATRVERQYFNDLANIPNIIDGRRVGTALDVLQLMLTNPTIVR